MTIMKKKLVAILCVIMAILIIFPIVMDILIIGNNVPSNISNESWVSFLGGYSGAIITGAATFIAFYFSFFQLEKHNKNRERMFVLPYLDVSIDEPQIDYSKDSFLLRGVPENTFRAMYLNEKKTEYCGRYVYDFLESDKHDTVYESVIYPNIIPDLIKYKSVGVQLKQVIIKNIGLNSAISVNVYINKACQWQFNLEKDSSYTFFFVLDKSMFGKRIDIQLAFKDLLGNEYQQSCFAIFTPNANLTGNTYQKSITQSPLLTVEA